MGPVLALALIGLGVVAIHDLLHHLDVVQARSWVPQAVADADGFGADPWVWVGGAVAVLVGLCLIRVALTPRTRSSLTVSAATGVHVRTRDVARLASATARAVDGVLDARSAVTRRKVSVTVRATSADVRDAVTAAVTQALQALEHPPSVRVRVRVPHADEATA